MDATQAPATAAGQTATGEAIDELSKWTVGLGMLILVLFPFSLPILILTAAALAPLLVPLLALGLLAGLVAAPIMLTRRLLSSRRPRRPAAVPMASRPHTAEPQRP